MAWPSVVSPASRTIFSMVSTSSLHAVLIVMLTLYLCNKTNIHTEYNTAIGMTTFNVSNEYYRNSQINNNPRIESLLISEKALKI